MSGESNTTAGKLSPEDRRSWKRLAMQALRYLTADQIAEAAKAAGAEYNICATPEQALNAMALGERIVPITSATDCRSPVGEVVGLIDAAIVNLRLASRSPNLEEAAVVAALADLGADREVASLLARLRSPGETPEANAPLVSANCFCPQCRSARELADSSPETKTDADELARAKAALEIGGIYDVFTDLPDAIQQMQAHIKDLTEQRDRAEGREPHNPIRRAGEIVDAEDF